MKARHTFFLCAVATLLLSACEFNGGSIYATIETAKKTIDSTLAKTLTVQDLVARVPGVTYDIAAGAIYEGSVSGSPSTEGDIIKWRTASGGKHVPPPVSGQFCTSLVFLGGTLWGAFFNPDDSTFGLYQSNATPSFTDATADPYFAGKQIMLLQVTNDGKLFAVAGAVTENPYVFELDYFNGTTWTQLLTGLPSMITGVAWDGTYYWAVGGTSVYQFTPGNPPALDPGYPTSTLDSYDLSSHSNKLNGIFTDGTQIFIPSETGGVYYSPDGSPLTWSRFGPDSISGNTVAYLAVAGPVDAGDKYLVGADIYGYYYLSVSGHTLSRFNDSTILLYSATVRRILVDPSISCVFMGTAGGGLWRATFSAGGAPDSNGWIHE